MPRVSGLRRSGRRCRAAWMLRPRRRTRGRLVRQEPAAAAPPAPAVPAGFAGMARRRARGGAGSRASAARPSTRRWPTSSPLPVVVDRDRTQAELTLTLDQYLKRRLPRDVCPDRPALWSTGARTLLQKVEAARTACRRRSWRPSGASSPISDGSPASGRPFPLSPRWPTKGGGPRCSANELFAALTIVDARRRVARTAQGILGRRHGPAAVHALHLPRSTRSISTGTAGATSGASTPDVLASIAHYLKERGWVAGQRWGREVSHPGPGGGARGGRRPAADGRALQGRAGDERSAARCTSGHGWASRLPAGQQSLPASDVPASLVRVDRHAFLVYANYEALLAYNCAHTYALSVAMLADQLD